MKLSDKYQREDFINFLGKDFLGDFKKDIRPVSSNGLATIHKAHTLGRSKSLDLEVFEICLNGSINKRISLTKDAFSIMKSTANFNALAVFYSSESEEWRLSLMTLNAEKTEKGKAKISYSNPKRYSYLLGKNAKINTPTRYLIAKSRVIDFNDLKSRFSLEVVNKDFYKEISELFIKLVGGTSARGKTNHSSLLKLPFVEDKSRISLEFAVRLIGRIIFCWFLREKHSHVGKSLMPKELLSLDAVNSNNDYYHKILEPIFFKVLNEPIKSRQDSYGNNFFESIPYLNGGLFFPHDDDYYSSNEGKQAINHNIVVIPDIWFKELFSVLETYNFTIDENVSFDEELSIDPEMLGRIFENLLAEINPETGESARKSTGSYYTPRVIVEYMVDESIYSYLQTQTKIDEKKLRSIISYDFNDDPKEIISAEEKNKIINALESVKILDPACGSGAFPIGALQKIVFILQQVDADGKVWFQKQIQNISPEMKRVIEREFENENFDYIRKLGVVRKNIYGIDIQPIATEISRLRCFLTLIVDESIHDNLENRGIEPLPNLDFKFVTANSLIGLPKLSANNQEGLFEDRSGIEELKELREMFFNASGAEREKLKLQFVQAQNRMFEKMITARTAGMADLTTKLTTWDPFGHKAATWFDPEWMFGIKEGFGIVMGNPPYVSVKSISKNDKKRFSELFETGKGRFNLFTLFLEKGHKLLKDNGVMSYILPEVLYTNSEYNHIRKYLLEKTQIFSISNFSSRVFDASVDTSVIIIKNGRNKNSVIKVLLDLKLPVTTIKQSGIKDIILTKNPKNINVILDKINYGKESLSNIIEVQQGIIYSGQKKEKVFSNEKIDETCKKILDGRDIHKYSINYDIKQENRYIKYTKKLHRPREERLFLAKEKLVFPRRSVNFMCTIDTNQFYLLNTAYICLLKNSQYSLKYILGILNSKVINFLYSKTYIGYQITIPAINSMPIPKIIQGNKKLVSKMQGLVDKALVIKKADLKADIQSLENQIDKIVYELYNLSPEEIKIVELNSK